jgi:hypothetical protein
MAIIIGVKQSAKTYQLLQEKNNFSYINSSNSSNLLFLNVDDNTNNNAVIRFKNNYEIGYINNNITIKNVSNLLTVNSNNINLFKNVYFDSNINVNNYFYTSNNKTFFNNNIRLNLNNNINNSFRIDFNDDNQKPPILEVFKNSLYFNSSNIHFSSSNIFLSPTSVLYTNFIDSPNEKPVVIKNMSFAESLRIFSANIVQNIALDNDIVFTDLINKTPYAVNPYTVVSDEEWSTYMTNNGIDINDRFFAKPNIYVNKYLSSPNNSIGGSNIVEFRTRYLNSPSSNIIFTINNKGYISIGSNYNSNIPLKINITPEFSNIIQYTNLTDINKNYCINSNGFINIGTLNFLPNQLNIYKNNNLDRNNSELISLNINNTTNTFNTDITTILFKNNKNYTDFIINIENVITSSTNITFDIIITNNFIINNIIPVNSSIYTSTNTYITSTINSPVLEGLQYSLTKNIKIPRNIDQSINTQSTFNINDIINIGIIFNIVEKDRNNNIITFLIYPKTLSVEPTMTNINLFNKISYKINSLVEITIIFYIYIYDYSYKYSGKYYPKLCNLISGKTNNNTIFEVSQKGNIGIGTNYIDNYKLFIEENASINYLNCKSIDNYLTKNISMCNCILNDIYTISNIPLITATNIISTNNTLSYINNNNCIINSNLTVLANGGKFIVNTVSIFSSNNNQNQYQNYLMNVNCINNNDGIVIKNDNIGNNPNLAIISSCASSYPYIKLENIINSYNIGITSTDNFQLLLTKSDTTQIKLISNDYINNGISILNNSFNIFKDTDNNIKIFTGYRSDINNGEYYASISSIGNNINIKSSFNIYGNFNLCTTLNEPLITCFTNENSRNKIGIGLNSIDTNRETSHDLVIKYNTLFNSNISVNGNINLGGTILSISDCNLKTNIHKIENALEKIETISGYTYTRTDTGNIETGLIAQEVLRILPEVITYNNNYRISYGNMCGILVECIKELNGKIKILNDRIEKLENS